MDWKEFCKCITNVAGISGSTLFGWKSLGFIEKKDTYTPEDIQVTLSKIPYCIECGERQPMGAVHGVCAKCNEKAMTACHKCGAPVHKYFNRELVAIPICRKCALNAPHVKNAVSAATKKSWALHREERIAATNNVVKSKLHRDKMKIASKKVWARDGYKERLQRTLNANAQAKWENEGRKDYPHATRLSRHVFRCKHCEHVYIDWKLDNGRQPSTNYCPNCRDTYTGPEKQIEEYLLKEGIQFITHYRPEWLDKKELDFYIPEKNLAIEINGVFFHAENSYGARGRTYHLNKTEACELNGIHLIHIWDVEITHKWEIVKDRLSALLGKNTQIIGARQCKINQIDTKSARNFLEKNHIQGYTPCAIYCGLIFNGEIIGVGAFHKGRTQNAGEWELARYASKLGMHVSGGLSKVISWFKRTVPDTPLISYADRRWTVSTNNAYREWAFIRATKPTYHYAYHGEIHRREKFMLKHLHKNPITAKIYKQGMTESECCEKVPGLFKIWDCGQLLYRLI